MGEKATIMVLEVDLQCPCCYRKVKKIICKFPQIRDQVYNEKANTVTITVVCCNPEKIRDKLCCKGAKVIKSIEIKEPQKPKNGQPKVVVTEPKEDVIKPPKEDVIKPPKEDVIKPHKEDVIKPPNGGGPCSHGHGVPPPQNEPALPPPPCKPPVEPCPVRSRPVRTCCGPCSEGYVGGPCYHGYGIPPPPNEPARTPPPPPHKPAVGPLPMKTCCGPCSEGYGGGPCYHGYGVPPRQQLFYDGCYGYDHSYGYGKPYHVTRCDYYVSEENPGACAII